MILASGSQVREVARRAAARPESAFRGLRLPAGIDVGRLLSDIGFWGVTSSYERPDRDFSLIAVGEAGRAELPAGGGAAALRLGADELLRAPTEVETGALRPRLLGGVSFGATPLDLPGPARPAGASPDVPWEGFGRGALLLPEMLFVRDGGEAGVVLAPGVPATRLADVLGALARGDSTGPDACGTAPAASVACDVDAERWLGSVARVASEVRAGHYEKVVLATCREFASGGPIERGRALRRLRDGYRDCHLFSVTRGDSTFLGASPELLVSLRDGAMRALGLAGSAQRGADAADDERRGRELQASAKDRIEHEIVVRAIREALLPASRWLRAPNQPGLLRLRNIQHLATEVRGEVSAGVDILDLVERLHPTPAVGGWPTERALRVIADHERFDRGWYGGPVGWLDAAGDGEFAVALRSALVRRERAWLFAGAGIMGDSEPGDELAEVELKFRPLAEALGLVPGGEAAGA
ncbi:MAG: isochorismate synthase [Chloroflexi bacterium]|nr:isochorismate synthase [Chloroflexota bacterium]